MSTNSFLPFANSPSANVISDADYQTQTASGGALYSGVTSGIARSNIFNKIVRQSSVLVSSIAQLIVDTMNVDMNDSLEPEDIATAAKYTIRKLSQTTPYDAEYVQECGGYPLGAIVTDASGNIWVSSKDNNGQPPSSASNWVQVLANNTPVSSGTSPDTGDSSGIIWSKVGGVYRMSWSENNVYEGKNITLPYTFSSAHIVGGCPITPTNYSAWLTGTVGGSVLSLHVGTQNGGTGGVATSGMGFSGVIMLEGYIES